MSKSRTPGAQARAGLACVASALALCACSVTPPYQRPDLGVPQRWAASPEQAAHTTPDHWWTGFQSSQLDALVATGLREGSDVQIALARLEQARGSAQIAGASRYPTVNASLNASNSSASAAKRSASLQANMDLDLWGRNRALTDSALMAAEAAQFDVDMARNTLAAAISTSYFQLLSLDERLSLAKRIAQDAQSLLSLAEKQAAFGVASALDVEQQRNALQTFLAAVPVLQHQRDDTFWQLAVLVGAIPENFKLTPERLIALQVPAVGAISPADAIARRPEVLAAEARLKAANFDVGAARAALLPNVSIAAEIGALLNPASSLWSLSAALLQPVFNGGALKARVNVDRAHAEELLATYRQAVLRALQDTESQLSAVAQMREAETLNEAATGSASESLRLARIRFERGASDLLAVIINERTLYQAQDTLVQTRLLRLQATAALYRSFSAGRAEALAANP